MMPGSNALPRPFLSCHAPQLKTLPLPRSNGLLPRSELSIGPTSRLMHTRVRSLQNLHQEVQKHENMSDSVQPDQSPRFGAPSLSLSHLLQTRAHASEAMVRSLHPLYQAPSDPHIMVLSPLRSMCAKQQPPGLAAGPAANGLTPWPAWVQCPYFISICSISSAISSPLLSCANTKVYPTLVHVY
jgi:hypothetical protein